MRALKILVVVMGVMIVAGFAVIAVTIFQRFTGSDGSESMRPPAGTGRFGPVELTLPPGARVLDSTIEGGRLLVRLQLVDGATRLMVVDMASGQLLGMVDLRSEGPK